MNFERGSVYEMNYGAFSKVATFKHSNGGINYFFDINGEFGFSDEFLTSGKIIVTELDTEF